VLESSSKGTVGRVLYRIWQFRQSVRPKPLSQDQWLELEIVLSKEEMALYKRQDNSGQRHAYRVMKTIQSAGHTEDGLLKAALLHDIGKLRQPLSWWQRPMVVLVGALLPGLANRLAREDGPGWRQAFAVKYSHPDWGAQEAERAGSPAVTVNLIRRHQDPLPGSLLEAEDRLLSLLVWADNRN
jgi:hypothetical protein